MWNSKSSIASTAEQDRALQRRRQSVLIETNNIRSVRKQADRQQTGIHRKDATLKLNQTKQNLMKDPKQIREKKSDEINKTSLCKIAKHLKKSHRCLHLNVYRFCESKHFLDKPTNKQKW